MTVGAPLPRRLVVPVLALGVLSACALLPAGWTGLYGRRTASGTVHTGAALTAAHRSLPFGTRVRVTNLKNGRAVVVVVDDRGPFVRGRVIDLSLAAAPRRTPLSQSCRAGNQVAARAARAASD